MSIRRIAGLLAAAAVAASTMALSGSAAAAPETSASESAAATYVCLYRLYADNLEDWSGPDEAYLKDDGTTIWGPKDMIAGGYRTVRKPVRVGSVVALYDQDAPDPDDWLGSHRITDVTGDVDVYTYGGSSAGYKYRLSVRPRSYCP